MRAAVDRVPPAAWVGLWLVLLALAWDATGWDLAVMRLWGDAQGFALRHQPWLSGVAHDGTRRALVWVWVAWLLLLAWGRGPVREWAGRERLAVALGTVLALLVVNLIKRASLTSCPWDLAEFGGPAQYVSHWVLGVADGGGAHCFPGGHASSALAFVAAALPLLSRPERTRQGLLLLGALLLGGAWLGAVQTVRGAHYPSHTLWTMVICYAVGGATWWLVQRTAAARQRPYQPSPM